MASPPSSSSSRQLAPDPPRLPRIPLAHKRVPTEMRAPHEHAQLLGAALVGAVDIAELRADLLALPESYWGEAHNRVHNVHFQRPFHDKLGVGNIMCVFSDTQLESVFTLPLYAHYRHHLARVFAAIDVHPDQVVRCLFARMPPGAVIPAHHDNGPWVAKTHRMHVPIVTFPEVAFCSGPLESSMTRYAFNEGAILELNNAAKHSVANPTPHHRIHLIFDYVEPSHATAIAHRVTLPAGQVCRQVRGRVELVAAVDAVADNEAKKLAGRQLAAVEKLVRARLGADAAAALTTACRHYFIEQISAAQFVTAVATMVLPPTSTATDAVVSDNDSVEAFADTLWRQLLAMFALVDARMSDELARARTPPVFAPNWVIIGAQKCGTTSLFELLSQHPQVTRGGRREPHFFDWAWPGALQYVLTPEERAVYAPVLARYAQSELSDSVAGVTLEENSLDDMRIKYLLSLQCDRGTDELQPPVQIGESTPSYLLYGETVAKRMKLLYPDMKLLVMLRDPVKRAFSHYQMTADATGSPAQLRMRAAVKGKSFEDVVDDDLALLRQAGVVTQDDNNANNDKNTDYDGTLDWFQQYADALSQQHGAHAYVGRGLYALQLALWLRVFPREQVLVLDLDDFQDATGTQRQVNCAFDFLGLPRHDVADTTRKNTRAYDAIPTESAAKLRAFYAPFNEQLFELVGRRFQW